MSESLAIDVYARASPQRVATSGCFAAAGEEAFPQAAITVSRSKVELIDSHVVLEWSASWYRALSYGIRWWRIFIKVSARNR